MELTSCDKKTKRIGQWVTFEIGTGLELKAIVWKLPEKWTVKLRSGTRLLLYIQRFSTARSGVKKLYMFLTI